jgi:uncharacterized protein (TIGR03083 family)
VEREPGLPRDKTDLLARIERSWAELERTIGRLGDAQLTGPRDGGGWAVKDHLAHLAAWERSMAYLLRGRPRHEGLGVDERTYLEGDEDEINDAIFRLGRDRPLPETLADWRETHRQLLATLAGLGDADLQKTYSDYLPDEPGEETGEPIVGRLAGNTYEHYDQHRGWIEALVA